MSCEYAQFTLQWQGFEIEVSYQANWLNFDQWHIELRCTDPLPVTSTGYRSHFVPEADLSTEDDIRSYITDWLDTAAKSPEWPRYLEDSRQLKLF